MKVVQLQVEDLNAEASRKLNNHRKLISAARKLFTKHGYHNVTTRDIAGEAGVVQGTFYAHFQDKVDCYLALIQDVDDEVCQVIDWYSPPDDYPPAMIINSWVTSSFSFSAANPNLLRLCWSDIGVMTKNYKRRRTMHPLHKKWIELIDKWKQAGQASPDFDSFFYTFIISDTIKTGTKMIVRKPGSEKEIIRQTTNFLLRTIKAEHK